jgi:hypothetical protein
LLLSEIVADFPTKFPSRVLLCPGLEVPVKSHSLCHGFFLRNSIPNWWLLFNNETINDEIFQLQNKPRCRACVRSKPSISQSLLCPRANRVVGGTGLRSTSGPFQRKRSPIQSLVIPRSVQFIDSSVFCDVKLSSCNIEWENDRFVVENVFLIVFLNHKLIRNFSNSSDITISSSIEILRRSCFR